MCKRLPKSSLRLVKTQFSRTLTELHSQTFQSIAVDPRYPILYFTKVQALLLSNIFCTLSEGIVFRCPHYVSSATGCSNGPICCMCKSLQKLRFLFRERGRMGVCVCVGGSYWSTRRPPHRCPLHRPPTPPPSTHTFRPYL